MKLALDAPAGRLTRITQALIDEVSAASRASPRRRMILPLHQSADNTLHRMLNAVQPDSYIRPHRHPTPAKDESFVLLQGALAFFTFEDDGRVRDAWEVQSGGVDLKAGPYHSFIALAPDTVIFEVKPGPYEPSGDKAFAAWAPAEGGADVQGFMARLLLHPRTA
jgi:cupin fold WbuC family metalloprotein